MPTDDAVALDSISSDMSCTICTSIMVDPRTLDCGHVFCLRCIYALTQTAAFRLSSGHLRCPMRCDTATMLLVEDAYSGASKSVLRTLRHVAANSNNNNKNVIADDDILQVVHPEIAGGRTRHKTVDAAILALPRNHAIRNVCLALRRRQLQLAKKEMHHPAAATSSSSSSSVTAAAAAASTTTSSSSSSVCCDICITASTDNLSDDVSMCDVCGAYLCAVCRANVACEHAMLCSSSSSSSTTSSSSPSSQHSLLRVSATSPLQISSAAAAAAATSSGGALVVKRPAYFCETVALAWTVRKLGLTKAQGIQQCHLDLLPFRCVTVRCSATTTTSSSSSSSSSLQVVANDNKCRRDCDNCCYTPPRTVTNTYRVWVRRGIKPHIEPLVSFGDSPSPERALLHDLQAALDNTTRALTAIYAALEQDIKREAVLHPRINDDALVFFFYCRLVEHYCFYLRTAVLPYCECFLTAAALVGVAWAAELRRNLVPPVVPRPSALYEAYVLRHLARQEELANETSRLLAAQIRSCVQKAEEVDKSAKQVAAAIVARGKQADNAAAGGAGGVSSNSNSNGATSASHHPPIIDIHKCWRQLSDHIDWTCVLFRRLSENIETEFSCSPIDDLPAGITSHNVFMMNKLSSSSSSSSASSLTTTTPAAAAASSSMMTKREQTKQRLRQQLLGEEEANNNNNNNKGNDDDNNNSTPTPAPPVAFDLKFRTMMRDFILKKDTGFAALLTAELQMVMENEFLMSTTKSSSSARGGGVWKTVEALATLYTLYDMPAAFSSAAEGEGGVTGAGGWGMLSSVHDLRWKHARTLLEQAARPEHYYHYYNSDINSQSSNSTGNDDDGITNSMMRILKEALSVQCAMYAQRTGSATANFDLYLKFQLSSSSSFSSSSSSPPQQPSPSFDFAREKARQTLVESVMTRIQTVASFLVEMPLAGAAAVQQSLLQRAAQADSEHDVHLMSRIDPRVVVPKSSTTLSAADKTLPATVRVAAEKHALQRFVIDYAKKYQQPTNGEVERRKRKTKQKQQNGTDYNDDDDDGENVQRGEDEEGEKAERHGDDGHDQLPAPLDFDSASDASSNFDGMSDGYDEDLLEFLQQDDTSDDDDDDDSSDDDDGDSSNEFGASSHRQQKNRRASSMLLTTGKCALSRKQRVKRIRKLLFPRTTFHSTTVSHRVVHEPYFLARIVHQKKVQKERSDGDDENKQTKTKEEDDNHNGDEEQRKKQTDDNTELFPLPSPLPPPASSASSASLGEEDDEEEEEEEEDHPDEILLIDAFSSAHQVISKRTRIRDDDDDDEFDDDDDINLGEDDEDEDDDVAEVMGDGFLFDDARNLRQQRGDEGGGRAAAAPPLAGSTLHRLARNSVAFLLVNAIGFGVAGAVVAFQRLTKKRK